MTTVVADENYEGPRPGLYVPEDGSDTPPGIHRWMVLCLDLENGDLLWERTAHEGPAATAIHPKNSLASATPVTDGERVYALFGNVGLFAYDFDGVLVWSRDIERRTIQGGLGAGSSPALLDDQVIVLFDNDEDSYLASFDAATGAQNWRVARDEPTAWSTPFIWRNDLRTEIVTVAKNQVRSYDPSGSLLWWFSGRMSDLTVTTPIPGDGIVYVSSGYVGNDHRPVFAVLPGAEGNITLGPHQRANEYIRWYQPRVASYNPSPILYRGIYYTLHDRGFFTAHDARTGRTVYDRVRIEPGATFTASPWAYNGRIFALSEDGDTYVIAAGPDYGAAREERDRGDGACFPRRCGADAAGPDGVAPLRHPPIVKAAPLRGERRDPHQHVGDVPAVGHEVAVRRPRRDVQHVARRHRMARPARDARAAAPVAIEHLAADEQGPRPALDEHHVDDVVVDLPGRRRRRGE